MHISAEKLICCRRLPNLAFCEFSIKMLYMISRANTLTRQVGKYNWVGQNGAIFGVEGWVNGPWREMDLDLWDLMGNPINKHYTRLLYLNNCFEAFQKEELFRLCTFFLKIASCMQLSVSIIYRLCLDIFCTPLLIIWIRWIPRIMKNYQLNAKT